LEITVTLFEEEGDYFYNLSPSNLPIDFSMKGLDGNNLHINIDGEIVEIVSYEPENKYGRSEWILENGLILDYYLSEKDGSVYWRLRIGDFTPKEEG
jgi:hypothetical protein